MSGIYFHIPFCKQACYYCDFHFSTSFKKKGDLIAALLMELNLRKNELKNETIETIYFGGGTPSVLSIQELRSLIEAVYDHYPVSNSPEITLEANPDDMVISNALDSLKYQDYKDLGINRLSIGIQSFFEDDLKRMNRSHSAEDAKNCLSEATKYFDNISIDLIYGIPNMDVEKWNRNLDMAFDFGIKHISSYALTIEPKTALDHFIKKGKYPSLNDNLTLQHFNHLVERVNNEGFIHYEISNFGKPNYFSKHNTGYWQGKSYLGFGPSAHSFQGNQRTWNISNNAKYIQAIQNETLPKTIENLTMTDHFNEYIMTGLRTVWGVSLDKIENEFGKAYLNHLKTRSKKFIDRDLLIISTDYSERNSHNGILKTTPKGKFLVDGMASDLFMLP
ncbi:radical SAM family heme chaperone HemW [Aestuariivivens sediminis]|uniref:radical SAM family heme chaperone HemW n=1 Tax=Aestuariivivens sediminis TaxID=2913557 RepID=UPI001F564598|nr:radical SAM family heme chaperone HemW [Aestuariivivens sediminis]